MSPTGLWLVPLFVGMPQPFWPQKDVSETRDYGVDLSRILPPAAVIVSVQPSFNPPDAFACRAVEFSGSSAWVRLAGGVVSPSVLVTLAVSLKDGQLLSATIGLPVARSAAMPSVSADPDALTAGDIEISVGGLTIAATRPELSAGGVTISVGGDTIDIGG